jgi:hypothetical protein
MSRSNRCAHHTSQPTGQDEIRPCLVGPARRRRPVHALFLALAALLLAPSVPALADCVSPPPSAQTVDGITSVIVWMIRLLGGNPGDPTGVPQDILVAELASQYGRSGIPPALSPADRLALMAAIQDLWVELDNPPPDLSPAAADLLRLTLKSMWADLTNSTLGPR